MDPAIEQTVNVSVEEILDSYTIILSDLQPFTGYNIIVTAATRVGEGTERTTSISTDPAASSPPTDISAVAINSSAIMLAWNYPENPRGVIQGYMIMYGTDSFQNAINITLEMANDNRTQSIDIDELQPFTEYQFKVNAFSFGDGIVHIGIESEIIREMTLEAGKSN